MSGSAVPTIEDLIQRHSALLYRYAYRLSGSAIDAEDLTQQAFCIAQQKLHQLRTVASAKSWLCTILRREYLRSRRHLVKSSSLSRVQEPEQPEAGSLVDEEALQQALNQLPEEYRTAVILFYFQELSYQEIADALQVPVGTVMSRLSRGRSLLKSQLQVGERSPARHAAGFKLPAVETSTWKLPPLMPK